MPSSDTWMTLGSPFDQRWRSIVKARTLVLAVHDHFLHKFSSRTDQVDEDGNTSSPDNMEDSWTLEYINILRLQPIIEAFDDDASGFVSIAEVNRLASARPRNWRSVSPTTSSHLWWR